MKSKAIMIILALLLMSPAFSQNKEKDKDAKKEKKEDKKTEEMYAETVIEDFEKNTYDEKSVSIRNTGWQKLFVKMRDDFPAHKDSKRFMSIKVFGQHQDAVQITPATTGKTFPINGHCKSLSIWVYGKEMPGELSVLVQDIKGDTHKLVFGKLNFFGWKKLTVHLPAKIMQGQRYLGQERHLKILKIVYNPAGDRAWNWVNIDDLTGEIRKAYQDRDKMTDW